MALALLNTDFFNTLKIKTMTNIKRVLAIDDDRAILDFLRTALEDNNYLVDLCEDENEARTALSKTLPDIVLIDASMPGIDGISLCRHMKSAPSTADIPIIIVTAYDDEETKHDAFLFGADEFISKPFEVKDLLEKIEKLTSSKK